MVKIPKTEKELMKELAKIKLSPILIKSSLSQEKSHFVKNKRDHRDWDELIKATTLQLDYTPQKDDNQLLLPLGD